jgi:acyl-CoA dehydrogenase
VLNGSKTFITNGQHANLIIVVAKTDPKEGAKGTSLIVVETDDAPGFERGRKLKKLGMKAPTRRSCSSTTCACRPRICSAEEGQGFVQLMQELPQERLIVGTGAIGMIERALALTIDYVKERKAFGKAIIEFQNTQFKLAELQDRGDHRAACSTITASSATSKGELDTATASMAKYWLTDLQARSSTAACNCSAAMATWTNIRSRACTATPACSASTAAPTRS